MAQAILEADPQELQQKFSSCHISLEMAGEPEFHQVFLSHAGNQKPFVIDLYKDFLNWPRSPRIHPFFDQSDKSLPKGEELPDRIFEAARNCVVAVVILTKEYVTSKWPMLELITFVEAKESTNPGLKLLPVFYDNQPTPHIDDSWIAQWEKLEAESSGKPSQGRRDRTTSFSVQSCKDALRKLRKSNGLHLPHSKSLESLRQEIIQATLEFLPSSSEIDTENVQGCLRLCTRISEMFEVYKENNRQGPQCVGLYGMGGLGKTTICNALRAYFGPDFNHKVCHLEFESNDTDQKESKFKRHILILKKLSDVPRGAIESLQYPQDSRHAEISVRQCLSTKPVFLAVDNVQDDRASSEEAQGYLTWMLSPESKIIITSRSRETVLSVMKNSNYCKPIPYLEEEEAKALFLKIAEPDLVNWSTLDSKQNRILREWLQVCFFPAQIETNHGLVPVEGGDQTANTESGHYHPLALQAVASFLKDLYPEPDSILCWERDLNRREVVFYTGDSQEIFDVLGIGFENMDSLCKQIFIDVALYAPTSAHLDTFEWLQSIHDCHVDIVKVSLNKLRKKSFLNYNLDGTSSKATCINISVHELYKEYAKRYLTLGQQVFKYGVYVDGYLPLPPSEGWTTVSRIYREKIRPNPAKVRDWVSVVVLRLVRCETITAFLIGELLSLRDLEIYCCQNLELLSWTHDIDVTKQSGGSLTLRSVTLHCNERLRKLPDFSNCSELQSIVISKCSRSMEPLRLHSCSNLQQLLLKDDGVPEVQSLQSCSKLRNAQLAWKATHDGSPLLENLPSLRSLSIENSTGMPFNSMQGSFSPADFAVRGKNLQHPKDGLCYDLSGVGVLKNLNKVHLTWIPLGKLPVQLATVAPNLQHLCIRGCLLSQSVDFSAFIRLRQLSIEWSTIVKEVVGLGCLKELEFLDFSYCFQLEKVPDLRPLSNLKTVGFSQCRNLQGIPRLPPGCTGCMAHSPISEDMRRKCLAILAFAKPSPGPKFDFDSKGTSISQDPGWYSTSGQIPQHAVTCDGCMNPISGYRYKAKPVITCYDLCSICLYSKCNRNRCSGTKSTEPRWKYYTEKMVNYNLCASCFKKSGCDVGDFYRLQYSYITSHPD